MDGWMNKHTDRLINVRLECQCSLPTSSTDPLFSQTRHRSNGNGQLLGIVNGKKNHPAAKIDIGISRHRDGQKFKQTSG